LKQFFWVKILKFIDADSEGRDGKKSDPKSGINILDPQHYLFHTYKTDISDKCFGSGMFNPDSGTDFFHPGSISKILNILTQKFVF